MKKYLFYLIMLLLLIYLLLSTFCIMEMYWSGAYSGGLFGGIKAIIWCIEDGLLF